jgi:hypothetical protein
VTGSPFADIFVTGGGDTINGDGGPDLFVVQNGSNNLTASPGSGATFLFVAGGDNTINGGGNGTVDFSQLPAPTQSCPGVTVNLQSGMASGGFGGTQHLSGILSAVGTNCNDVLIGGGLGSTLRSLHGNDLLQAGPSGGTTLIGGGTGIDNDTFESSSAVAGTSTNGGSTRATQNVMIGGTGSNFFFTRNGRYDYLNGNGGFSEAQIDAGGIDTAVNIQTLLK